MYIKDLIIKNFRCFKEIKLENLPKLIVIIGENNSGKSTLLEALRYIFVESREIDAISVLGKNLGPVEGKESLWFRGDSEKPIEIKITLGEEFTRFDLPSDVLKELKEKGFSLHLSIEHLKKKEANIDRVYMKWLKIGNITWQDQELLFLQKIKQLHEGVKLSEKFKLIPVVRERNIREEGIGDRNLLISYDAETGIKELFGKSIKPRESSSWWNFKDTVDLVTKHPFEVDHIVKKINEEKISIPINNCGGGYQMFVQLIYEISYTGKEEQK
jgi:predicted ATP-dependent endonuclease of OLD family